MPEIRVKDFLSSPPKYDTVNLEKQGRAISMGAKAEERRVYPVPSGFFAEKLRALQLSGLGMSVTVSVVFLLYVSVTACVYIP